MFGLATKRRVKDVENLVDDTVQLIVHHRDELDTLKTRMKLLEKRLGVTFSAGAKKKAHYKVAGKVGRPRKNRQHGEV